MSDYTVVIGNGGQNVGAYVLDFDACVSEGDTVEEVTQNIHEAIQMHPELMVESGEEIPAPMDFVNTVRVPIPEIRVSNKKR